MTFKRYIRDEWSAPTPDNIKNGDYVVATKYRDGDPGDQFCIGFYDTSFDHYGQTRHMVVDNAGKQFRANGFRRVARISKRRGEWMVNNIETIEKLMNRFSVWHWHRAPWSELESIERSPTR